MASDNTFIFDYPKEAILIDPIDEILKNNGLGESSKEFVDKDVEGIEPRAMIIRDAALTIAGKKIPEEQLVELLQKHLGISKETSEKILSEIKQKIVPYIKMVKLEKEIDQNQIKNRVEKVSLDIKKTSITNTEENTEKTENGIGGSSDKYRELIE